MYKDIRNNMHPGIAKAIQETPENLAILNGDPFRPLTFGGMVTRLVEGEYIDSSSMENIKKGVCELTGLDPDRFTDAMADPFILSDGVIEYLIKINRQPKLERLTHAKKAEVLEHLETKIVGSGFEIAPSNLSVRADLVRSEIEDLDRDIQDFTAMGFDFRKNMAESHREYSAEQLEKLQSSAYAIRLLDLIEIIKNDEIITTQEDTFVRHLITNFSGKLMEGRALEKEWWFGAIYRGEIEEAEALAGHIWLSQTEVALLADVYAHEYYSLFQEKNAVGRKELDALTDPISEIFTITDQERASFFEAFPLANGRKPRLLEL